MHCSSIWAHWMDDCTGGTMIEVCVHSGHVYAWGKDGCQVLMCSCMKDVAHPTCATRSCQHTIFCIKMILNMCRDYELWNILPWQLLMGDTKHLQGLQVLQFAAVLAFNGGIPNTSRDYKSWNSPLCWPLVGDAKHVQGLWVVKYAALVAINGRY